MKNILKGLTVSGMALLALAGGSGVVFAADATTLPADATDGSASGKSTAEFKVEAGDTGKLTLDKVPDLNFGTTNVKDIATKDVTLSLVDGKVTSDDTVTSKKKTATNGTDDLNLEVSDYRGGTTGWDLYAQLSPFTAINSNVTLKATKLNLSLKDGDSKGENKSDNFVDSAKTLKTIEPTNTATPILTTAKDSDEGLGKNVLSVLTGEKTQLTIGKNTQVKAGTYQADVTWTLGNTFDAAPANSNE